MTAKIDIKTPSGIKVEGFPKEFSGDYYSPTVWGMLRMASLQTNEKSNPFLTPGDTITIEIL